MTILDIRFGSEHHKRLLKAVVDRRKFSKNRMECFHEGFNNSDDTMRAYIKIADRDNLKKARKRNQGTLDYVTFQIPYSYSVVMSAHAFWCTTFMSRDPVWQLNARHGEGQDSVQGMEAIMDYNHRVGEHEVPLFNWNFDMAKYGFGVVGNFWANEIIRVPQVVEEEVEFFGIKTGNKKKRKVTKTVQGYQGNKAYNIRVYDWFPDPRVPINQFQKGEFCGRDLLIGWHEILKGEAAKRYMNIKPLRERALKQRDQLESGSAQVNLPYGWNENEKGSHDLDGPDFVKLHEMVIEMVPSQWGLGNGKVPEKWVFTVANEAVIIAAEPLGMLHNKFPYFIQEFGMGTDEFIKPGLIHFVKPFEEVMSWLINSHFYSVRNTLNDVRIADPTKVVMKDILKRTPVVRLKPAAYGQDIRSMVHQLQFNDPTQGHLGDTQAMAKVGELIHGITGNLAGVTEGDRATATEKRIAANSAITRLRTVAEYNSALGWSPLAQVMVSNIQQNYDLNMKFRIAGNNLQGANRVIQPNPEELGGFFDFVPVDGTAPIDRLAQANFWKEFTGMIVQSELLAGQFDLAGLVLHIMKLQGERNVERFRLQSTPDGALQQQVQAGNVVPVNGGANGPGANGRGPGNGTGVSGVAGAT